jgi:hypothetical protein
MRRAIVAFVTVVIVPAAAACTRPSAGAAAPPPAATANAPAPEAGKQAPPIMAAHGSVSTPTAVTPNDPPPGGLSIADVIQQRKALAGKPVTVRGTVVKANNGILGRNWIHLQDGSGSAADRTNDLTITSDAVVKVGDVITVTGVLAIGVEIGEGYGYDALVEKATIVK